MSARFTLSYLSLAMLSVTTPPLLAAPQSSEDDRAPVVGANVPVADSGAVLRLEETRVLGTAEEELKQAPGVSIITAEDIQKRPPSNDLSEIIRREPGVNLTGNSTSGNRGNNRQIDLRGMGPENTLILIDGRPSTSRNAVRYGWNGDRDTRGETNWVPAEEVERIEILRGPAAARYGSGAMGGVINIITKRPTEKLKGSLSAYVSQPQDDAEGASRRTNFNLSGPLADNLSFRVYGGLSKTDADDLDINAGHRASADALVAGREGVRNKDVNALLSWQFNDEQHLDLDLGYSRQGNIYAGDTMLNNGGANPGFINTLYGKETSVIQRGNYALTHSGNWSWGSTKSMLSYDYTRNERLNEGLAGATEGGAVQGAGRFTSRLRNTRASSEVNLPLDIGLSQMLTLGVEYLYESLNDPGSLRNQFWDPADGQIPGFSRDQTKSTADSYALYAEDNIELGERTIVTPGLRYDHHEDFGGNWSPSLNASHRLTDELTLKGGIARAYKTPNLYQSNPSYLLYSRGFGCNQAESNSGGCYLVGNQDLKPETSINKEIGLAFDKGAWRTSATYFRNDYKDKIDSGNVAAYRLANGRRVMRWENTDKAVVEGLEGNLFITLAPSLEWNTNLTYMVESEDKQTGEPLSIIPEYTLNTSLDWQATERLSLQFSATRYGTQESPSYQRRRNLDIEEQAQQDVDPYNLVGVSAGYAFSKQLNMRLGVNNLFDKRIYREGNADAAGASTYNEPGRAYYLSMSSSF